MGLTDIVDEDAGGSERPRGHEPVGVNHPAGPVFKDYFHIH
jgi:hypothetical protein